MTNTRSFFGPACGDRPRHLVFRLPDRFEFADSEGPDFGRAGIGEEAQDLTQEFFTRLLEKNPLRDVHTPFYLRFTWTARRDGPWTKRFVKG